MGLPLGLRGTTYAILLVPKEVSLGSFSTLRQAEGLGVKVIGAGGGPP
jgi:hypothetical protein